MDCNVTQRQRTFVTMSNKMKTLNINRLKYYIFVKDVILVFDRVYAARNSIIIIRNVILNELLHSNKGSNLCFEHVLNLRFYHNRTKVKYSN